MAGRDDHLWALARAERAALAQDLSALHSEQWREASLCGQWDVEEVLPACEGVVAHLREELALAG